MAATDLCRRALRRAQLRLRSLGERRHGARGVALLSCAQLLGALGGLLATGDTRAADLPENRADLMLHSFSGGGVYIELQQRMQDENRRFTTLSNVLKARHETAKTAIGNIR